MPENENNAAETQEYIDLDIYPDSSEIDITRTIRCVYSTTGFTGSGTITLTRVTEDSETMPTGYRTSGIAKVEMTNTQYAKSEDESKVDANLNTAAYMSDVCNGFYSWTTTPLQTIKIRATSPHTDDGNLRFIERTVVYQIVPVGGI